MRLRTLLVCITLGAMLGVGLVTQSVRSPGPDRPAGRHTTSPGGESPDLLARLRPPGEAFPRAAAAPPEEEPPVPAPPSSAGRSTTETAQPDFGPQPESSPPDELSGTEALRPEPQAGGESQAAAATVDPVTRLLATLETTTDREPRLDAGAEPPEDSPKLGSTLRLQRRVTQDAEQSPIGPPPLQELAERENSERAAPATDTAEPVASRPDASEAETLPAGETTPAAAASPAEGPSPGSPPERAGPPSLVVQPVGEGDQHLEVFVYDRDVREVLALLSRHGGWNILPTRSVQGRVSLALSNVDLDTALAAVLRATGYVARREGNVIYVGTAEEFSKYNQSLDVIATRVYRPSYVSASELEQLLTPLLTPQLGKIKASTPAAQGIAADGNAAGGNDLATGDVLVVQDYESVLRRMDQIVREVDRRPAQVAIEAMILSVELDDENKYGVDFELLRDKAHIRLVVSDPLSNLSNVQLADGMLNVAYLDSSVSAFVEALETIGDTNVIATPRLLVLNKQRAEILIGAQLGYVNTTVTETSATQSVDFLEVGTQLRLRPYIAHDRMIRLEIHPELSTGNVRIEQGITLPDKEVTSVTTNVLVEDGRTVIIGGLMREELVTNNSQVPLLGSLPVVGVLFQEKTEVTKRREILVLVTPRIVDQQFLDREGDSMAAEFHRRQQVYADKMLPWGKRYLGRKHFRLAQEAWARGDQRRALRHVNLAIHFDPMNRAAIDLRSDILNRRRYGPHTLQRLLQGAPQPVPVRPPPEPVPADPWSSGRSAPRSGAAR